MANPDLPNMDLIYEILGKEPFKPSDNPFTRARQRNELIVGIIETAMELQALTDDFENMLEDCPDSWEKLNELLDNYRKLEEMQ